MDAIFFGLKRAHQGSLRVGHQLTKEFGLTPARFDLMVAVKRFREEVPGHITQRELRRILGVSAPTVSRMVRSLEVLRLIWRGPRSENTRRLGLTARGRALIRRALKRLFHSGLARRIADRALRRGGRAYDFMRREELDEVLGTMRRFFGDTATLAYPWHPDD